ncbi:MAG: hypothetical protein AB7R55_13040 [Gemmatimonadales bacterium]
MPIPVLLADLNLAFVFAHGELLPTHLLERTRAGEWIPRQVEDDAELGPYLVRFERWASPAMAARRRSRLVAARERELRRAAGPAAQLIPAALLPALLDVGRPALAVLLATRKDGSHGP